MTLLVSSPSNALACACSPSIRRSAACSAAVLDTEASAALSRSESVPWLRGHAEALMPLIARVDARRPAWPFADLDRIVVTTGPGSFTGLRVGIAAARGIALAADKPAVGVSTLSAYAAPYLAPTTDSAGGRRHRCAA